MSEHTKFWLPLIISIILGIIALTTLDIGIEMKIIICLIALWLVSVITTICYGIELFLKGKEIKNQEANYNYLYNEHVKLYNEANETINNLKTDYAQLTSYAQGLQLNNEELNKQLEKAFKVIDGLKMPQFPNYKITSLNPYLSSLPTMPKE